MQFCFPSAKIKKKCFLLASIMNKMFNFVTFFVCFIMFFVKNRAKNINFAFHKQRNNMSKVQIKTSLGDITVRLYDETPLHRDNFIKLAKEGYYNGTLFHRVIKNFMIQGGDPDSKGAAAGVQLGTGGPGYTVPAEFVYPQYFHKKGALAAARQSDQVNPEKKSSGSQFYIVTGEVYSAGKLTQLEKQLEQRMLQSIFDSLVVENRDKILQLRRNRDQAGIAAIQEQLQKDTFAKAKEMGKPKFTDAQREAYTTVGGTPFLDNDYTVFGEVEEGMDVIDAIQNVATGAGDRPSNDVVMIEVKVIE